ncbi:hypothetical protein ABC733_18950 [Mangrovibacter sp. SLW1]
MLEAGDLVNINGEKTTVIEDIIGIAVDSVGDSGFTSMGQIENTVLYRNAEVKDLVGYTDDEVAKLQSLTIDVITTLI